MSERVTRGTGLLESFLAGKRVELANSLIPASMRGGRILDIGCGTHPFFLLNTEFFEKYGLDKVASEQRYGKGQRIEIKNCDIETAITIPFPDLHFDVVTMLAVFEHIEPEKLAGLLSEIRRVMKPGGVYILTTPSALGDIALRIMAVLRLVSPEEIHEHKASYSHAEILAHLSRAGFNGGAKAGHFEFFMNSWAVAVK